MHHFYRRVPICRSSSVLNFGVLLGLWQSMGRYIFYTAILLLLIIPPSLVKADGAAQFDVTKYGAKGDGITDDTQAFLSAWNGTCGTTQGNPTMFVPKGYAFLVRQIILRGPCRSNAVNVQIRGAIVAPESPSAWDGLDAEKWISFESVDNLAVSGEGQINGRGQKWWSQNCKRNPKQGCTTVAPTALSFYSCNGLALSNIQSVDSPQSHILVYRSHNVTVSGVSIKAPATSPNTDGIHIQAAQHVKVLNSEIGTGDDCVSIGDNTFDVIIYRVTCGPGHGISIGSLGADGTEARVELVNVAESTIFDATNGARIKTWQGGRGYARSISFQHISFTNVQNPIIIDQYYCIHQGKCENEPDAVQISNVTFAYFSGTSKSQVAISLNCSRSVPCTNIYLDNIYLTPVSQNGDTWADCINAHGETAGYMHPTVNCLGR